MIAASPMHRAIQTCLLSFSPCVNRGLVIVALPLAQETTDELSDIGSPSSEIKERFGAEVDTSLVEDGWDEKVGEYSSQPSVVIARAAKLRRWLKSSGKKEISLVTHGRFAHFLTGDVNEKGEQTTGWWQDAEVRTFAFDSEGGGEDDQAPITETQESRSRRGCAEERHLGT